jgi:amino acid transporter
MKKTTSSPTSTQLSTAALDTTSGLYATPPLAAATAEHSTVYATAHDISNIETQSAVFAKELRLRDLVLTQILVILVYNFVGTAGKLGAAHVWYWIPAVVLFYIPLAAVVSYLNRQMPLEGGIYQWAKLGFTPFMGFFVAWNTWLYVIAYISSIGLEIATYLSYALGPQAAWLASNKLFIVALSCLIVLAAVALSVMKLERGKMIYNVGSMFSIIVFVLLIALPFLAMARGVPVRYPAPELALPAITALSLNILMKMAFGALSGFEYVAVFAGEAKNPARSISLSIAISAPILLVLYILGTSSVLVFTGAEQIDLIGPVSQTLSAGFALIGADISTKAASVGISWIAPVAILMLAASQVSYSSLMLAGSARLPMVAGWDNLLPAWFSQLHPTYQTPVNSILFIGCVTLAISVVSILGVGSQEAFQMILSNSFIFYAISYLVMFAVPLFAAQKFEERPSLWVRLAAVSGGVVSAAFIVLSLFPIVEVRDAEWFAVKIAMFIVGTNLVGIVVYWKYHFRLNNSHHP